MQYRELWGFYLLGFPSVVRELGVFYVVVYQDSPIWSGFDFFFESFVRFVVSFMNGLNGDSSVLLVLTGGSLGDGRSLSLLSVRRQDFGLLSGLCFVL